MVDLHATQNATSCHFCSGFTAQPPWVRYLQLPTPAVLGTVAWKRGYASKTSACNPVEFIISLVPATIMWIVRTKIIRWYSLTAWSQQLRWESLSELMWLLLTCDFVNESQRKPPWLRQVYLLECVSFCNGGSIYHQLCGDEVLPCSGNS